MTAKLKLFSRFIRMLLAALLLAGAATIAFAQSERVLYNFSSFPQGLQPSALAVDVDGSLYFSAYSGGEHGFGAVMKLAQDKGGKWVQSVVYSFRGFEFNDGAAPNYLLLDDQGNIYGIAASGGSANCDICGTIFKLTRQTGGGWSETTLHFFGSGGNDAIYPFGRLVIDRAGNLYGSSEGGGQYGNGAVFELSPTSSGQWVETTLYSFTGKADGNEPASGVVADASGNLYGMTLFGGDLQCGYSGEGCGVVFQLSRNASGSWQQKVLYSFPNSDNAQPAGIAVDQKGSVYGTRYSSVFEVAPSNGGTWTFNTLHTFSLSEGEGLDSLLTDNRGNVYGTAWSGGSGTSTCWNGCGTVFRLTNPGGAGSAFSVLYSFQGASDGMSPDALAFGSSGQLYGVSEFGGHLAGTPYGDNNLPLGSGTAFSLSETSEGWSHAILASLPPGGGTAPVAGLISDARGNLYGTASQSGPNGLGSVFEMERNQNGVWSEKVIYGAPQGLATGNLTFDASGNLYGAGQSTIFRLTPSARAFSPSSIIYNFNARSALGSDPNGVVADAAGNLYGTTSAGGINRCYNRSFQVSCGVVFKLSEDSDGSWSETVLHAFAGASNDGGVPLSGLTIGPSGELYGTTNQGGTGQCYADGFHLSGCGVVFRLVPNNSGGWTYSILHNFLGADGILPSAGVTLGLDGTLYGTTPQGGPAGYGLAYKLTPSTGTPWTFTPLHGFGESASDGQYPSGNLALDRDGNLYGVAQTGGFNSCGFYRSDPCGIVFKLLPQSSGSWTEVILHHFSGSFTDGGNPEGGLLVDGQGHIFGTTSDGGEGLNFIWNFQDGGTVFEIVP